MNEHEIINYRGAQTIVGKLSGKQITIPNVNVPPMPSLAPPGVIHNGKKAENFGESILLKIAGGDDPFDQSA